MGSFLQRTLLDRLQMLVPVVFLGMSISLLASESTGIPITPIVVTANLTALAVLVLLYLVLRWDRVPLRWAHPMGALVALMTPTTTLTSIAETGRAELSTLLVLELFGVGLLTSTRWTVAMLIVVGSAWGFVAYVPAGPDFGYQASVIVGASVVALVFHIMMVRMLVRAERARLHEADVAAALATQLADRERAEAEHAAVREQLFHAQRLEAVGTLAAGLAHDMNNILGAIMSYADLIATASPGSSVKADCDGIVDEAERGAVLTRSLLAFSRRGQYRKEPIALEAVVSSVTTILSRTLPKAIVVEHVIDDEPTIDADIVQLGQVLVNLCLNGADAIERAGRLTIVRATRTLDGDHADRLSLPRGRTWAVLEVIDTGRGMDEATRRRIFEPFFTTKPAGKGTGLGLALVYGVVAAHAGAIEVSSASGKGSRFTIYLPTSDAVPAARSSRIASGRFDKVQHVLVVDDEPAFRTTATRVLERLGLAVATAANGAEALILFEREPYSVVVLDMGMPVMGGAECFRKLRERSSVPILITSGYALENETQELLSSGRTAFLEKPFPAAELAKQVRALIAPEPAIAMTREVGATP
jgi:signal transduction histidine kinase/ActR/RegA family two-component response regulator